MLIRAWLFLGLIVAILSLAGFFAVLAQAGWHSGEPDRRAHPLPPRLPAGDHDDLPRRDLRADWHGLRGPHPAGVAALVGVFSNRYLLWAIAGELAIAAMFVFAPPCQALLGTAVPPRRDLLLLIPFPFIVWGADELRKWVIRTRSTRRAAAATSAPA